MYAVLAIWNCLFCWHIDVSYRTSTTVLYIVLVFSSGMLLLRIYTTVCYTIMLCLPLHDTLYWCTT